MKLIKHILSFAAAAGLIAACQTPEIVQVAAPENVVPAALHELEVDEIAITATNQQETVEFSWEEADYGAKTALRYSVEAALTEDGKKATIVSGIDGTTATVTYEELNRVLFNDLEVPEGEPTELKIYVGSVIYSGAVTASFQKIYSQPVSLTVTVTAAEKVYPKVWVIGDYCGWSHDKTQFLFDFAGDDKVYQGVVDFGEKAANGWKVTGVAGWDDTCNWGGDEAAAYDHEAAKTQLINGGGSKDLKHYSKRFYHFSFEKGALLLTKTIGFDQIGVIGDFNGWGADAVMDFDAKKQKFYADVEFPADGGFKFRLDGAWDISYGIEGDVLTTSGGNISVKAGNYRVYLNMNNYAEITYELSKSDYGAAAPEPEPEPEPEVPALVGWGLVGELTGWADGKDIMLASDGTYLTAKGVELSGQFKFRKDGAWTTNLGAPGDVEPFELTANAEAALVGNGKNMTITAGTYDVYLDEANSKAWFINDGSYPGGGAAPEASEWGVVGQINSWGATPDIVMYKTSTEGLFVAYKVEMPEGPFKIRANNEWNDEKNYGLSAAGNVEVDHAYDVITSGGSANMTVAAGTYDIWFDLTNKKVYIMSPDKPISEAVGGEVVVPDPTEQTWYMVGNFNDWNPADEAYKMTVEGDFFVFKNFVAAEGCEAKFAPGAWNGDKGIQGAFAANAECATGSGNIPVAAGTYDVYLAKDLSKFYFMTDGKKPSDAGAPVEPEPEPEPSELTWYLVGQFNGWNIEDKTYVLTKETEWFVYKGFVSDGNGFKFHAGSWSVNRGATGEVEPFALTANTAAEVVLNGKNLSIAAGTYDVYMNLATTEIYVMNQGLTPGQTPTPEEPEFEAQASEWGIVGVVNSWNAPDITMYTTPTNNLFVARDVNMPAGGFKIRANNKWDDTKNYGLQAAGDVEVDHVYNVITSGGSGDMTLAAGTYDIWFDLTNTKVYIMTPGKPISEAVVGGTVTPPAPAADVWGVVGSITNWADKADINMIEDGDWLVAKSVALTATDEFKFRTNGTWGNERTAESADPVAVNTEYKAVAGSGNIKVAVAGTFDLYLAKSLDKFYVMEQGLKPGETPAPEVPEFEPQASEWGVVGDVNGWNAPDITMYTTPTNNLFVARNVQMPAGGFKIRANGAWNDAANYGVEAAGNVEVDHVYKVITSGGSGNMTLVAGTYDIWFDLTNTKVYIMTPGKDISEAKTGTPVAPLTDTWYLVGDFNGWKAADAAYKMSSEGTWYVFKNFTANGKGVKFVADANWSVNRGGTFKANAAISLSQGGADMMVTAGTYDVYLSSDAKKAYFMTPGTKPAN